MTAKQLAELKDQINELLEKGYLYPSPSQEEPVLFSSQGRMYLTMCVYYHALNEVTIENKYRCLGLMICLINYVVHVCSPRSIFDWDRIS
jgi:hypothetical protein